MYLEDTDLCRTMSKKGLIYFYPLVHITHSYEKGSYKNWKLLSYHIKSAIKYFNKWGWIIDIERKKINKRIYNSLQKTIHKQ